MEDLPCLLPKINLQMYCGRSKAWYLNLREEIKLRERCSDILRRKVRALLSFGMGRLVVG